MIKNENGKNQYAKYIGGYFLLILLNVQIIAEIPVFEISYIWISLFGMLICLFGLIKKKIDSTPI